VFLLKLAAGYVSFGVEQRCLTALALVVPGCFLSQGVVVWCRVGFSLGFPQLIEHCMVWPRFP
jgi:hypothetical protein